MHNFIALGARPAGCTCTRAAGSRNLLHRAISHRGSPALINLTLCTARLAMQPSTTFALFCTYCRLYRQYRGPISWLWGTNYAFSVNLRRVRRIFLSLWVQEATIRVHFTRRNSRPTNHTNNDGPPKTLATVLGTSHIAFEGPARSWGLQGVPIMYTMSKQLRMQTNAKLELGTAIIVTALLLCHFSGCGGAEGPILLSVQSSAGVVTPWQIQLPTNNS